MCVFENRIIFRTKIKSCSKNLYFVKTMTIQYF